MPKENKKRGRRGEKRKHEDAEEEFADAGKRRKSVDEGFEEGIQEQENYVPLENQDEAMEDVQQAFDRPFFGMLDEDEQEYFKRADDMLEMNSFGDEEERTLFLANVYREAEGKEMKIALSQSCSRLMERLIQLSTASQLKGLFQKFSGNFIHIVSHRFGSHCCETLFIRASLVVAQELRSQAPTLGPDEVYVTMENLFLHTISELEGSIGYLMNDPYASHVLRILLIVLSGEACDEAMVDKLFPGKSKEVVKIQGEKKSDVKDVLRSARSVPKSLIAALERLIGESVAGLDTEQLRALASHPNANPTLQLLLKLELTAFGKGKAKDETSVIRTLLPDDPITADSGSARFISGIVYDKAGSHLVETIIRNVPGKTFKSLYKEFFKERIASLARNEIASYVACTILERLGKDDLKEACALIVPTIPGLLERNRTVAVTKLVERCAIRDVDTKAIAAQISNAYEGSDGFDITRFLKYGVTEEANMPYDSTQNSAEEGSMPSVSKPKSIKTHFSLLAQAMLTVKGPLSNLIMESLIKVEPEILVEMAKDPNLTFLVQRALTSANSSVIQRRKLIQHFYGNIGDMGCHRAASYVVDCIWEGTYDLTFIRERIAEELAENERALRDSASGRVVWKKWSMDLYKRKRITWINDSKAKTNDNGRFQPFSDVETNKKDAPAAAPAKKTALELAREKHVKAKAAKEAKANKDMGSGANARPVAAPVSR